MKLRSTLCILTLAGIPVFPAFAGPLNTLDQMKHDPTSWFSRIPRDITNEVRNFVTCNGETRYSRSGTYCQLTHADLVSSLGEPIANALGESWIDPRDLIWGPMHDLNDIPAQDRIEHARSACLELNPPEKHAAIMEALAAVDDEISPAPLPNTASWEEFEKIRNQAYTVFPEKHRVYMAKLETQLQGTCFLPTSTILERLSDDNGFGNKPYASQADRRGTLPDLKGRILVSSSTDHAKEHRPAISVFVDFFSSSNKHEESFRCVCMPQSI